MRTRGVAIFFLALCTVSIAGGARAATTVATVLIDTDLAADTGCAFDGQAGFEHALKTTVEHGATMATTAAVEVRRCVDGTFAPAAHIGGPWAAGMVDGTMNVETRVPYSLLGTMRSTPVRLVFVFDNGTSETVLATMPDGSPIIYPKGGRRRSVRPSDGTQSIVSDGDVTDWSGVGRLLHRDVYGLWVHGGAEDLHFRFDVNAESEAPEVADDTYSVRQGRTLNVDAPGVLANDSDPDGSDLTASLVTDASHGVLSLEPDGGFVYVNDGVLVPSDIFEYKASDGSAESAAGRVTINITPNGVPVANGDSYNAPPGGTLNVPPPGVLGNDHDPDHDPLSAQLSTAPAHGSVTLNQDGSFQYTHNGSTVPSDAFTYTVTDGLASSDPAIVMLSLSASNAPPVAADDVYDVVNGGTLSITSPGLYNNDTDIDTPRSQWSTTVVATPSHGVLTVEAGGAFTFVHDGSGADDFFTYRISDGVNLSNIAHVDIRVVASGTPITQGDQYTTLEDTALTVSAPGVLGNDTDDGPLTAALVSAPVSGTVTLAADGSFVYTPSADFHGTDSFSYQASDGAQTSVATLVVITVAPVNDAPSFVSGGNVSVSEDSGAANLPWATAVSPGPADENGQTLSFVVSSNDNPSLFSVAPSITPTGTLQFTLAPDANGTALLTVVLQDDGGTANGGADTSPSVTFSISVTAQNDAPVALDDTGLTVAEGATLTLPAPGLLANDTDLDGDVLAASVEAGPSYGVLTVNADGSFTYFHDGSETSSDSFTYRASDGTLSSVATVSITITEVNDDPVATADSFTTAEDSDLIISIASVLANDSPGAGETSQTLTFAGAANGTQGVVVIEGTNLRFTPASNYNGLATFTYVITDDGTTNGVADPRTTPGDVTINVTAVNDAPTAADDSATTAEGTPLVIAAATLTANDATGPANESAQTLTVTSVQSPVNGTVSLVAGTITFTPAAGFNGTATFDYTIIDNGTTNGAADPLTAGGTVTITVTEANEAPTAVADAKTVAEDGTLIFPASDLTTNDSAGPADEAAQTLTVTSVQNPVNGNVALAAGTITFTPNADFNGSASFEYTVEDNGTTAGAADPRTANGTVNITVTEVNDAPGAVNDARSIAEDNVLTFPASDLVANDSKGPANESAQTLSVVSVENPVNGTVSLVAGTITFTPGADFEGAASFQYTITDNGTTTGAADPLTATGTVNVTVIEVNDAPVATDDSNTTAEDTPLVVAAATLTTNDSRGPANESGQTLTVTAVSNAVNGTVTIVSGTITFTPALNFHGTASFDYTLSTMLCTPTSELVGVAESVADPPPLSVNESHAGLIGAVIVMTAALSTSAVVMAYE